MLASSKSIYKQTERSIVGDELDSFQAMVHLFQLCSLVRNLCCEGNGRTRLTPSSVHEIRHFISTIKCPYIPHLCKPRHFLLSDRVNVCFWSNTKQSDWFFFERTCFEKSSNFQLVKSYSACLYCRRLRSSDSIEQMCTQSSSSCSSYSISSLSDPCLCWSSHLH